ncbi:MAG: hypothetical protein KGD63_04990 [Candidatus Lokiarchaeota archaeon]|nr:hypothetical protein [Candidatus Lokiarchaeota archaeon]
MSNINQTKVKKKKIDIWKEKSNIFFDVLKIELILIIHKETNAIIGQKNIHESLFDLELTNKLLLEIMSYEISSKRANISDGDIQKDISIFEYDNYKIILEEGNFIRGAMILNANPSYYLHKALETFVKEYEKDNQQYLETYKRKIIKYPKFLDLVEKIIDITLVFPHIINLSHLSTSVSPYQDNMLNMATMIQKKKGKFFLSELLNQLLLKKDSNEPKEKIIANIFDLRQYGYIIPIEK